MEWCGIQMFALLGLYPEYASKLASFTALGPAVGTQHIQGVMRMLAVCYVDKICMALGLKRQFMGAPNVSFKCICDERMYCC
jgi:hypothetical protein